MLQCRRCHHADRAHVPQDDSGSLLKFGPCQIPGCTCGEYLDAISRIDEDLL